MKTTAVITAKERQVSPGVYRLDVRFAGNVAGQLEMPAHGIEELAGTLKGGIRVGSYFCFTSTANGFSFSAASGAEVAAFNAVLRTTAPLEIRPDERMRVAPALEIWQGEPTKAAPDSGKPWANDDAYQAYFEHIG